MHDLRSCLRETLDDLDASLARRRAITLPNLVRLFERRWSRVATRRGLAAGDALCRAGRAWGRAAITGAYSQRCAAWFDGNRE